ncbi:MAG: polyribonucleotide nucleotidyltransferase [Candidatus Omnitrophica bacterium]|nr:polyribonucleotide nucleotidyltransferase [Candidatus Omnitrophota bacterium]
MEIQTSVVIGQNKIIFQTGKLAKLSSGAITATCGETIVLTAVDATSEPREDTDFLPLTVDYRERMYAAGKIPGGFFKREGKPTEREILVCRLIDRPIRSLFDKNYFNDVQVMATVLSADGINNPDILAMNSAAAALAISPVPFDTVFGAVRVALVDGQLVGNPTLAQTETASLDLILAATREKVVMIEAGANEVGEEEFLKALKFGHDQIKKICDAIEDLRKKAGKPKPKIKPFEIPDEIRSKVAGIAEKAFDEINQPARKEERAERRNELWSKVLEAFDQSSPDFKLLSIKAAFEELEYDSVRKLVLKEKKRPDGRRFDEIRPLACEVGVLPRTHGSALFTRGQTQSLGVTTLGAGEDEQKIDGLEGEATKRFMLHYNFPPFSVGEVRPSRGVGRREVGHGALAERALKAVLPNSDLFPYTIRLVSDILESNGSSSMASVSSGSLALMDAGVPIKSPVGGIAMGLFSDEKSFGVLTDIAGVEDHLGDMDFKVAGTEKGITAVQVDIKISGLNYEIITTALTQAKKARLEILDFMAKTIRTPRESISKYAPRYVILQINPEKIKIVIGPGGKMIKEITKDTGVKIDIEDSGKVTIFASDEVAREKAVEWIKSLTAEAEVGKVYQGKVRRLLNFGAFCEIMPGVEGLVHISELAEGYVPSIESVAKIGDEFPVKVINIDEQGRVNLSAKQAGAQLTINPDAKPSEHHSRGPARHQRPGGRHSRSGRDSGHHRSSRSDHPSGTHHPSRAFDE